MVLAGFFCNLWAIFENELEYCPDGSRGELQDFDRGDQALGLHDQDAVGQPSLSQDFAELGVSAVGVHPEFEPLGLLVGVAGRRPEIVGLTLRARGGASNLDVECIPLLGNTQGEIAVLNLVAADKHRGLLHVLDFPDVGPVIAHVNRLQSLGLSFRGALVLVELGVCGSAVLIFVQQNRDDHFEGGLVDEMHGGEAGGDLHWLDMVPPQELAAGLHQDKVQLPREARFLDEQEHPVVNVFSEESPKRRFTVVDLLLRSLTGWGSLLASSVRCRAARAGTTAQASLLG